MWMDSELNSKFWQVARTMRRSQDENATYEMGSLVTRHDPPDFSVAGLST